MTKLKPIFTFVECEDKKFGFIWWALKVGTSKEFISFIDVRASALVKQYWRLKENIREKFHLTCEQEGIRAILDNYPNRKTVIDDINILSGRVIGSYQSFWIKGKTLLINQKWGFRFLDHSVRILSTVVKDEFVFPFATEKDIRIMQWRNGKHYYAKIGNLEVQWEGKLKWDSYEEAKQNAKEFLESKIKSE